MKTKGIPGKTVVRHKDERKNITFVFSNQLLVSDLIKEEIYVNDEIEQVVCLMPQQNKKRFIESVIAGLNKIKAENRLEVLIYEFDT